MTQVSDGSPSAVNADRWKLGLEVASAELMSLPEQLTCYMLHIEVNGTLLQSRSHRCSPRLTHQQLILPLSVKREIFCGPGTPLYPCLLRKARDESNEVESQVDPSADALVAQLVELQAGRWLVRATSQLSVREILSASPDEYNEFPLVDTIGAEIARLKMKLRTSSLFQSLQMHHPPTSLAFPHSPPPEREVDEIHLELNGLQMLASSPMLPSGSRGVIEVQIGSRGGWLHTPLVSKVVCLPTAADQRVSRVGWRRSIQIRRNGHLWNALRVALTERDDDPCNLTFFLLLVSAGRKNTPRPPLHGYVEGRDDFSTRRGLGTATWSLRSQLLGRREATHERCALRDARGVTIAFLWLSVTANATLHSIWSHDGETALPPPSPEFLKVAEPLICVVRLQACVRGLRIRRRARLLRGAYEQAIRIQLHSLQLSPELCCDEKVSAAALHVELAGVVVIKGGEKEAFMRPRVGSEVGFEMERTLPLERGSRAFNNLRDGLRLGANTCELRVGVTAERRVSGRGAAVLRLLTEQRYSLGEATLDLRELCRVGSDLLEHPLPLYSKAKSKGALPAASVVISLEAIEAIGSLQKIFRLSQDSGRQLLTFSVLQSVRLSSVLQLQVCARRWLARETLRRHVAEKTRGADDLQISIVEIRSVLSSDFTSFEHMQGKQLQVQLAVNEQADAQMLHFNDMEGNKEWTSSEWFTPCELAEHWKEERREKEPSTRPFTIELSLEHWVCMRHGGRVRSILREALYYNQVHSGVIEVRMLLKTSEPSGANDGSRFESHGDASPRDAQRDAQVVAKASLPILSLSPSSDSDDSLELWLDLCTAEQAPVVEVKLQARGVQTLRRLRIANQLRTKDQAAAPFEQHARARRRRQPVQGETNHLENQLDAVDHLREMIIHAAGLRSDNFGQLSVSSFFCNPGLT